MTRSGGLVQFREKHLGDYQLSYIAEDTACVFDRFSDFFVPLNLHTTCYMLFGLPVACDKSTSLLMHVKSIQGRYH